MLEVEIRGDLNAIADRLQRLDNVGRITTNEGLRNIGRLFVPSKGTGPLADETPKRTGKLARSTYFRIRGTTYEQQLEISQPAQSPAGAYYGYFMREGTKAHVIKPRNGKYLRFEVGGETVFARQVHHPGTKANPYHKRVFDRLRGQVEKITEQMGKNLTAYISGKGGV